MISGVVNHLWQSTVFSAAAALLAVWLRGSRAQVRYVAWLAASLKFLLPFSVLVNMGTWLGVSIAPAESGTLGAAVHRLGQAFTLNWGGPLPNRHGSVGELDAAVGAGIGLGIGWALTAVWICGFLPILWRRIMRWRRVGVMVRAARPLDKAPNGVPMRESDSLLEPGVFGVRRPVIVLPAGIAQRLSGAELDAVIAHELCHVRRRDNLAAALHMVVESLFWFYPLVWWLGARLLDERERACDEAVLELGGEPQVYAESILKVCEFYLESPLACVAGVTGSDLKKRMERIMSKRMGNKLAAWRKAVLAGLGAASVLGPLAIGIMNAPAGLAQEGGEGITGSWTGKVIATRLDGQSHTGPILLNLKQNGTTLTGSAQGDKFETPVSTGRIEGDKIHLELGVDQVKLDLRLTDGRLVGGGTASKDGIVATNLKVDLARAAGVTLDQLGGTWVGGFILNNTNGPMRPPAILHLKQDGKAITGTLGMDEAHMVPIAKGVVDGERVRLDVNSPENRIQGTFELGLSPTGRLLGDFIGADHGNPMKLRLEVSKVE